MSIQLNHTIVHAHDKQETADFLSGILGLPSASQYGPFLSVDLANSVTLDILDHSPEVTPQHYAFLVGEEEFDEILERIRGRGLTYWADPFHHRPNEINRNDGGRGLYWLDPNHHNLEIITRPYGSGE